MKIDDLKELESYIELVGNPPRGTEKQKSIFGGYDTTQLTYLECH